MLKYLFLIALFSMAGNNFCFGQGSTCGNIQPFCSGTNQYVFSNSNSSNSVAGVAEIGPNYGCLESQPFPAWFYLKIEESGNLQFEISQTVNPDGTGATLDVDFIAWGPFREDSILCGSQVLTAGNRIDCSYLPLAVEKFEITNAQAGSIYVVLITNYSQRPGYISLSQTNLDSPNAGTTDCSIVNILGDDQRVCGSDPITLSAKNVVANIFEWYVLNEQTGEYDLIPNETGNTFEVTEAGQYQVVAINSNTSLALNDQVLIDFVETPVAGEVSNLTSCSNEASANFNLNSVIDHLEINYPAEASELIARFYESQADVTNENPIANPEDYSSSGGKEIFANIRYANSDCISQTVNFTLKIASFPEYNFEEITNVCVDSQGNLINPVQLGKDLGPEYSYSWTPSNDIDGDGIEEPVFNISQNPDFDEVSVVITNDEIGCTINFSTSLKINLQAENLSVDFSGSDFEDGYTLQFSVNDMANNNGQFEYSIDHENWQISNIFKGIPSGNYTGYVRGLEGCGEEVKISFSLVGYPRFFTPNGDGYNDRWRIKSNEILQVNQLLIFDRYGKLIKELGTSSAGWDGTFNDKQLPADDYWFYLDYKDKGGQREFKGHFTLKR